VSNEVWYFHYTIQIYKERVNNFGMEDFRPVSKAMSTRHKLSKIDDSFDVIQTLYKSMIGKL